MGPRALSPLASLRLRWLLACGLLGPVLEAGRPDLEQTVHLSSYEIITPWRLTRERREALGPSSQQISYVIQAQGKQHIIHLERNTDLLPNDFVVYTYDKEGSLLSDHPNVQSHCHYRGYVEGVQNSAVAVSACFGLRGLLHLENASFGIEPLHNSSHFEHIFYPMDGIHQEPLRCGNKLVDPGEECDCGTAKECEVDPCCEGSTCKLKSFAECAYGDCCKDCQFLPGGSMCRGKTSECDVPEYCNGSSQFCPPDVFIQNGYPCQNSKAYCYNGMCQYYDAQCQVIFGSKAKAAPRDCFIEVNSKGDRFGNCGFSGSEYKKCATGNALCGKLQCENVQDMPVFGIVPAIIQTPSRGTKCWGVDFQLGSDVPDPGMVNEGTKCDAGKICRNFQCVNASVLNYDCDIQGKCHGHGVCNSNKNCHCEDGWAPPHCDTSTTTENIFSGKLDSGSARSCTSFI